MSNPGRIKSAWKALRPGRTVEKLRDTEEKYRAIFDRAIDSVGLLDMETDRFVDFNDNACNNLGYSREEFSKLKLTDIDVTLTPERFVDAHVNKPVQRTHTFETKHKTKSGEFRDVQISTRTFNIDNKPFSMITWRDITEYKQGERNLKESEERYHAVFDHAVDSILVTNIDTGEILDFNRQAHENLGYTREEFAGLKISDFDPSFKQEKERSKQFRQQGLRHTFMTHNRTKNGDIRDIQATIQSIHVGGKTVMMNIWHDVTEQKKAEEALRESEEKFSKAFNSASDAMAVRSSPGGKFIAVNDNYSKLTGYSREELIGHSTSDLNMFGRPEDYQILMRELTEKGRMYQMEFLLRKKSGEIRTCLSSAEPITISGKKCWIGIIHDVTEQNKSQAALLESEEKFSKAFNTASDAMALIHARDGNFIAVNDNYVKVSGYSREELVGHSAEDFNMWGNVEQRAVILRTLRRENRVSGQEFLFRVKSGNLRTCLFSAELMSVGTMDIRIVVVQDITERKKAEQAVRESEEMFSRVFDSASDAMVIRSAASGKFIGVNENYMKLTGYSREELINHSAEDLNMWVKPEDKPRILGALADEGHTSRQEVFLRIKSGEIRTCQISAEPITVGGRQCFIAVIHDITEQKAAEQKVKDSEEKFSKVFTTNASAIVVTRLSDAKIIDVNESYTHFTGYTREEVIGHTGAEFKLWVDDKERVYFSNLLHTEGKFKNFEMHSRGKSGEIRVGLASAEIINISGVPHRIVTIQDITERKEAEQRFRQASEEWQATFDSISDMVSIQDNDSRLVRVNQAYAKAVGMDREALVGRYCYEVVHHADCAVSNCPHQETLKTNKAVTREIFEPALGIYLQATTSPILNESGHLIGTVHIAKDITERKQAEEALQESEEKFSKSFMNSANAICIVKAPRGIFLEVNDSYARFTGYSREELIGHTGIELGLLTDENERLNIMSALKAEGKYRNIEVRRQAKSGEIHVGLASGAEINLGGEICHLMSITDITELKKAEEALRDSEEKFSKAFKATPIGMCIARNKDGRFIEVNDGFYNSTGYTHIEVIGHTAAELNLWVDSEEQREVYGELQKNGRLDNVEFKSRKKSGEIRTFLASAESLILRGEPCRMMVLADITERNKAEEALRDSEEKFSKAFRSTPMAVAITRNKDRRYIDCNESFCRFTGFSSDEVIGHTPDEVGMWVDDTERQEFFRELRKKGRVYNAEFRSRIKSGEIRTFLASIEALTIQGEPCRMIVLADITERKKHELDKEQNARFLQVLINSIPLPVFYKNTNGVYLGCNEHYAEFMGLKKEDFIGKDTHEISPKTLTDTYVKKDRELFDRLGTQVYESDVKDYTGKIHNVIFHKATFPNLDGSVGGLIGAILDITERKKAEEALRDSEEKFSKAFQATPNSVCITSNIDNRFIAANEGFSRSTGYCLDEIIGRSAADLNLWVDEEERLKFFGELFEKGKVYDMEFKSRMKSGEIRTLLGFGENLTIHGEPCRMIVSVDITERKKAEVALADSEKKLRIMFDSVSSGIAVVNLEGTVTGVNHRVLEMHGFTDDNEILGRNALDLVIPQQRQSAAESITRNLKERITGSLEYTLQRKDGSNFLGECSVNILNDAAGAPVGYIAVTRDITQRKEIELALQESETKYATLVENSKDGIMIIQDEKVKFANSVMDKLSGYNSNEYMEKAFFDFIPPKQRSRMMEHYRQRKTSQLPSAREAELITKDKRIIPVELSVSMIEYDGRPAEMAVIHDISERKQAEEQLQEAYRKETEMRKELEVEMKRRAEFTRALVHELKTPVTPILASSDGLMEILEEEPAKSLAANVNRGAFNLNKRIDELLDVARSELNILNVTMSPVNMRPILKEVAAEMSVVAKKKSQSLTLEVPHVLPKVNADYSRIKQVLDNLVTNAVKYTQKGGKITLSARESEGKLIVEVRDNGVGLSEEEMKKIFEPYYHKDNNAHQLSGLGLGLSLCKKFIELHGGEIWAESKPGKGSAFSFSLPVIPRK